MSDPSTTLSPVEAALARVAAVRADLPATLTEVVEASRGLRADFTEVAAQRDELLDRARAVAELYRDGRLVSHGGADLDRLAQLVDRFDNPPAVTEACDG